MTHRRVSGIRPSVLQAESMMIRRRGSTGSTGRLIELARRNATKLPVPSSKTSPGDESGNVSKETSPRLETKRSSFVETNFVETVKQSYSPGMAVAQSPALGGMTDKIIGIQSQHEVDTLKSEVRDLTEKLETLKIKRQQDKEKLKEYEKSKIQLEQLQEFKTRILESQNQLQRELQRAKQEAKEKAEQADQHREEMQELSDAMEMATLDKEMAEEKAESLQLDLEQAKEKIEELKVDLELLQTEMSDSGSGPSSEGNTLKVKQLEQQNERLREAIMKMRDLAAHDKHEASLVKKEMDQKISEIQELSRNKEKMSAVIEEYENNISDLKEQVDAALGAEQMVEQLTTRNLDQEEELAQLKESMSDLEALHEMNEEMIEAARDTELELREELDLTEGKLRKAIMDRETIQELISDRDETIGKFREMVQKQHNQIIGLQTLLEKETNKPVGMPAEMIDFKKMFAETKAHAKAIDLELRKIDVEQSRQHVQYLTAYMPESFMVRGGDHDAVMVLLLIPRLIWKSEILLNQVKEKFPTPEKVDKETVYKSHIVDQYSFGARISHLLSMLQTILHQYEHALSVCSVEIFMKVGMLYPEMSLQEKSLEFYVELLRKDQLDENIMTDTLEKCVTYFSVLYPIHLSMVPVNSTFYLDDHTRVVAAGCDCFLNDIAKLKAMLPDGEEMSEMNILLQDVATSGRQIQQDVKLIRLEVLQGSSIQVKLSLTTQSKLKECAEQLNRAVKTLQNVGRTAVQQVAISGDLNNSLPPQKLNELFHQATDKVYGEDDVGPDSVRNSVSFLQNELHELLDMAVKRELDVDKSLEEKVSPSPFLLRAMEVKNEMKDTERLRHQLDVGECEQKELKRMLKLKQDELSEMNVRKTVAEKKYEQAVKDTEVTVERLQRKLADSQEMLIRKEKEFEETMDHLQADLESLESEKGELQTKLNNFRKKTLFEGLSRSSTGSTLMSPSSPASSTGPSIPAIVRDSPMLLQQITNLQRALNHTRNENMILQSERMKNILHSMKPLKVPKKPVGFSSQTGFVSVSESNKENEHDSKETTALNMINSALQHGAKLQQKLLQHSVGMKVVDITKSKPAISPASQTLDPLSHLINHTKELHDLQQEAAQFQKEVHQLMASKKAGGAVQTNLTSFITTDFSKVLKEKDAIKIAELRIPSRKSEKEKKVPVHLTPQTFQQIHLKFLQ